MMLLCLLDDNTSCCHVVCALQDSEHCDRSCLRATAQREQPMMAPEPRRPATQRRNFTMTSRRRHVSPKAEQYGTLITSTDGDNNDNEVVIGIEICGWKICTNQGSIANEHVMNQMTDELQEMAQHSNSIDGVERRLCLPEMVFADAHVDIVHTTNDSSSISLTCNAMSALTSWARAHEHIPVSTDKQHEGVSVLKSSHAELWNSSKKSLPTNNNKKRKSLFDYDWTFSTPATVRLEEETNDGHVWKKLDNSGMPMHLLRDTTVPILLFDEVVLYEDDLHDNGQVSLSVKVRVMPTCVFLLQRLWVRVDGVLLRCRDTRLLVEFHNDSDSGRKIYRSVQWTECPWDDLAKHFLPTDVRTWRQAEEGSNPALFQSLLQKLPIVSLPPDIYAHAVLEQKQQQCDEQETE